LAWFFSLARHHESALPWKVDLVDRKAANEAFGAIIDATCIELG
jgi:hypothetical protein